LNTKDNIKPSWKSRVILRINYYPGSILGILALVFFSQRPTNLLSCSTSKKHFALPDLSWMQIRKCIAKKSIIVNMGHNQTSGCWWVKILPPEIRDVFSPRNDLEGYLFFDPALSADPNHFLGNLAMIQTKGLGEWISKLSRFILDGKIEKSGTPFKL